MRVDQHAGTMLSFDPGMQRPYGLPLAMPVGNRIGGDAMPAFHRRYPTGPIGPATYYPGFPWTYGFSNDVYIPGDPSAWQRNLGVRMAMDPPDLQRRSPISTSVTPTKTPQTLTKHGALAEPVDGDSGIPPGPTQEQNPDKRQLAFIQSLFNVQESGDYSPTNTPLTATLIATVQQIKGIDIDGNIHIGPKTWDGFLEFNKWVQDHGGVGQAYAHTNEQDSTWGLLVQMRNMLVRDGSTDNAIIHAASLLVRSERQGDEQQASIARQLVTLLDRTASVEARKSVGWTMVRDLTPDSGPIGGTGNIGGAIDDSTNVSRSSITQPAFKQALDDLWGKSMSQWADLIWSKSAEFNIDPRFIAALIRQESHGNPEDDNGSGVGLMQVEVPAHVEMIQAAMKNPDATNADMHKWLKDPEQNVTFGLKLFADVYQKWTGAYGENKEGFERAFQYYNYGSGAAGWTEQLIKDKGMSFQAAVKMVHDTHLIVQISPTQYRVDTVASDGTYGDAQYSTILMDNLRQINERLQAMQTAKGPAASHQSLQPITVTPGGAGVTSGAAVAAGGSTPPPKSLNEQLQQAQQDWWTARAANDQGSMTAAHAVADSLRAKGATEDAATATNIRNEGQAKMNAALVQAQRNWWNAAAKGDQKTMDSMHQLADYLRKQGATEDAATMDQIRKEGQAKVDAAQQHAGSGTGQTQPVSTLVQNQGVNPASGRSTTSTPTTAGSPTSNSTPTNPQPATSGTAGGTSSGPSLSDQLQQTQRDWWDAKARGDQAAMDRLHQQANNLRAKGATEDDATAQKIRAEGEGKVAAASNAAKPAIPTITVTPSITISKPVVSNASGVANTSSAPVAVNKPIVNNTPAAPSTATTQQAAVSIPISTPVTQTPATSVAVTSSAPAISVSSTATVSNAVASAPTSTPSSTPTQPTASVPATSTSTSANQQLQDAQRAWWDAKAHGDQAGMDAAHRAADGLRKQGATEDDATAAKIRAEGQAKVAATGR